MTGVLSVGVIIPIQQTLAKQAGTPSASPCETKKKGKGVHIVTQTHLVDILAPSAHVECPNSIGGEYPKSKS